MSRRLNGWITLVAVTAVVCTALVRAEQSGLDEMLQRMKAMEVKLNTQEQEIGTLRQQLKTSERFNTLKPDVHMQINRALEAKSGSNLVFHNPDLHKRSVRIGGYFDISYQYNLNRPDTQTNALRVFDNEDNNGFNVHLAELDFDGTAQAPGEAGFRLDLALGTDARKFHAFDKADILGGVANDRQLDLQQAYIDYIAPIGSGITFKFGKMVTPFGFEVIEAQENWNASRSYQFGYVIPFTHTGVTASYKFFDSWTLTGHLVNGWDNMQDNNDGKTAILQSSWSPMKWFTWNVVGAVGNERTATDRVTTDGTDAVQNNDSDVRYNVNTNMLFTPWETLSFGIDATWGRDENASVRVAPGTGVPNGRDGIWYGAAGYVKWGFLKNWYVAGRGEYLNDIGGSRTGVAQKLWSGTATVSWTLAAPLEMRFEYRHDGSSENPFADTESGPTGGTRKGRATQDTLMIQWLYKW